MKRFIVLAAGSVALVAGQAYAGGGCSYGQHAAMADAENAVDEPIFEEGLGEELLARLRKQEEEALEESLVVPNVPN